MKTQLLVICPPRMALESFFQFFSLVNSRLRNIKVLVMRLRQGVSVSKNILHLNRMFESEIANNQQFYKNGHFCHGGISVQQISSLATNQQTMSCTY